MLFAQINESKCKAISKTNLKIKNYLKNNSNYFFKLYNNELYTFKVRISKHL